MSVTCMLSAKGSPGVTTAMVGLALAWSGATRGRRAIAVDADPIGGDTAAGILRGAVEASVGVLPLATARGTTARRALDAATVDLRGDGGARLVPGVPDRARAGALPLAWDVLDELHSELHRDGTDLLIDCGRVERADAPSPWLAACDLAVLLARPTLASVTAAHRLASGWSRSAASIEALVIEAPSPYRADEVADAIGVPLLGAIPFDPASARVHSEGSAAPRGFERSAYARALRRVAADMAATAVARADLHLPAPDPQPAFPGGAPDGTF